MVLLDALVVLGFIRDVVRYAGQRGCGMAGLILNSISGKALVSGVVVTGHFELQMCKYDNKRELQK